MRRVVFVAVLAPGCFSEPDVDPSGGSSGDVASTGTSGIVATSASTDAVDGTSSTTSSPPADGSGSGGGPSAWRQTVVLDTAGVATELVQIPLPLRFVPAQVDYDAFAPDGSDLRIVSGDDEISLPFQVESWNPGGTTIVWVRLPSVQPGNDTTLYLQYGDPSAPPPPDPTDVWSAQYEAVWHLPSLEDATGNGHDLMATAGPDTIDGPLGQAARFSVDAPPLTAGDADGRLTLGAAGTVEAWVAPLVNSQLGGGQHRSVVNKWPNYRLVTISGSNSRPQFLSMVAGATKFVGAPDALLVGEWRLLAGTLDVAGNAWCVHVTDQPTECVGLSTAPDNNFSDVVVAPTGLAADLDEVRISTVARPPSWLELQAHALDGNFADYQAPQPFGG